MVQFKSEAPAEMRSQYIVAAYNATVRDEREIRVVFIIGRRFAAQELGIREARQSLGSALGHPKLDSYMKTMIGKLERKTSFAKSLYIFPEVNEDLAAYLDAPAETMSCASD